ncbi:hypothetical protein VPH35_123773 [Triticum aestivum]
MELRSGHRLNPPSLSVPRRRRPFRSEGGGTDRISALPDDLLLQVLVRLRCARTAALTSALARRWRGLWRYLAELSFREIAPDAVEAALVQVASPTISLLEIDIPEEHRDQIDPARVSALLRTAARLAPTDRRIPIEVPVFHRATSIKLEVQNLYLTPPAHGHEFPVLERLSVAGFCFDMDELIQRCPRLRVLEVGNGWGLGKIRVHSPTIEELVVDYPYDVCGIDIMAPVLRKFEVWTWMSLDFSVSFNAPMFYALDAARNFSQEIASLPKFFVLHLSLVTRGHIFGPLVLNLLGICTVIQKLEVVIDKVTCRQVCPSNCPCEQPQNWRSQIISLAALEEVEIECFEGTGNEIDFLKLLFRSTPLMKTMTMTLSPEVLPTSRGCKKTYRIFRENPSVKCRVYRSGGEEVLYP